MIGFNFPCVASYVRIEVNGKETSTLVSGCE